MSAGARLTELDLSDNAFGPDGVKGIEQLLKSPSCHTLRELKLNNCGMGIGGGKVSSQTAMAMDPDLPKCHTQDRFEYFFCVTVQAVTVLCGLCRSWLKL